MHKLFLFFIGNVMMSSILFGMEVDVFKEAIIRHVDLDTHRILATVCRAYNEIIEKNYRLDKKCIEQLLQGCVSIAIPKQVRWNNNFNRCAWVTVKQKYSASYAKKLKLTLVKLDDNKKNIIVQTGSCENYYCPAIEDQGRPFFDKEGGVFYYGVGGVRVVCLAKYSVCFGGGMCIKECFMVTRKNDLNLYDLYSLINFPSLLSAILKSTQRYTQNISQYLENSGYIYHIDGLILPEDYKTFKQHAFCKCGYSSYDVLPKEFRNAIDEQYEKQQREKMNTHNS